MKFFTALAALTLASTALVGCGATPSAEPPAKASTLTDAKPKPGAPEWIYSSHVDSATGRQVKTGRLVSRNSMDFDFPYNGIQFGSFVLRKHPRHGVDAFLSIKKGQLLCDSYTNQSVLIRFDNSSAIPYTCGKSTDYSSDIVFIEDVGQLIGRMKRAKTMYLTATVYGEGSRTWQFKVEGFTTKDFNKSKS